MCNRLCWSATVYCLSECSVNNFFILFQNHWGRKNPNKPSLKWLLQYGTKGSLLPSAVRICVWLFEYCSFMLYACFLLNSSVCSIKVIKYIWQLHYMRCIHCRHSFICVRMVKCWCDITQQLLESGTFIWSTVKHYKCYNGAESFLYSDFCISVTTKMNQKNLTNMTDCGKYKLSDS
jgi:hypothetical protein